MRFLTKMMALSLAIYANLAFASFTKGIYLTQSSIEDTAKFTHFIEKATESGINTFVIDLQRPSTRYEENITLLKDTNIKYIARIVMFPDGGLPEQVKSEAYWQKRWRLVEAALGYGATEIQLDYIRYKDTQRPSPRNVQDIQRIISWFKGKLSETGTPLQVDIFGVVSLRPLHSIGQDVQAFAPTVDALCPMLYPSHWEPFAAHAKTPYETLDKALKGLYAQFPSGPPFKVIPYIELFNYRYPLGPNERRAYIKAQIKAIKDNHADGWFAWSAGNKYDHFFKLLIAEEKANATSAQAH